MGWILRNGSDTDNIINTRWIWGAHYIFLRKWSVDFYEISKRLETTPVSDHLPGLLLLLWSKDVFHEIGNALGFYYEVNLSHQSTRYMSTNRILVGLKLFTGLEDTIIIHRRDEFYHQELDYKGIPFQCGKCHLYGHLERESSRNVKL